MSKLPAQKRKNPHVEGPEVEPNLRKSSRQVGLPIRYKNNADFYVEQLVDPQIEKKQSKMETKEVTQKVTSANDEECKQLLLEIANSKKDSRTVPLKTKENQPCNNILTPVNQTQLLNKKLDGLTFENNTLKKELDYVKAERDYFELLQKELSDVGIKNSQELEELKEKNAVLTSHIEKLQSERDIIYNQKCKIEIELKRLSAESKVEYQDLNGIRDKIIGNISAIFSEMEVEKQISSFESNFMSSPISGLRSSTPLDNDGPSDSESSSNQYLVVHGDVDTNLNNDYAAVLDDEPPVSVPLSDTNNSELVQSNDGLKLIFGKDDEEPFEVAYTPPLLCTSKKNLRLSVSEVFKSKKQDKLLATDVTTRHHLKHLSSSNVVTRLVEGQDILVNRQVLDSAADTSKSCTVLARSLMKAVFTTEALLECTASGSRRGQKDPKNPLPALHQPAMVAILEFTKAWAAKPENNFKFDVLSVLKSVNSMLNSNRRSQVLAPLMVKITEQPEKSAK